MPIYNVDSTDKMNSLETILTASGALTTTHYKDSGKLIFSTPYSDLDVHLYAEGCYVGNYVSGSSLSNSKRIAEGNGSGGSMTIIKTTDSLVVSCFDSESTTIVFGKLANNDKFVSGFKTSTYGNQHYKCTTYNTTADAYLGIIAIDLQADFTDENGKYYQFPIYFRDGNKRLETNAVNDVKLVSKYHTSSYEIYGDDVIVPLGYHSLDGLSNVGVVFTDASLIIPNGRL
jgi:hypothetical protein